MCADEPDGDDHCADGLLCREDSFFSLVGEGTGKASKGEGMEYLTAKIDTMKLE